MGTPSHQTFRRGKPVGPVERGEPARGSGTTVTYTPDPEIFLDASYDPREIAERLEIKTYLNKGLVIQFVEQRKGDQSVEFRHDGGVADFLDAVNKARGDQRVGAQPFVLEREDDEPPLPRGPVLDRGDRRARPVLRQHDPDPRRRDPRAGAPRGGQGRRSSSS